MRFSEGKNSSGVALCGSSALVQAASVLCEETRTSLMGQHASVRRGVISCRQIRAHA